MSKKTEIITFRTEEWVKEQITKYAKANQWSPAQTVEIIIKNFLINPHPNEIIVHTKDILQITKELQEEGCEAAEIRILLEAKEEKTEINKILEINGIENGGQGCIILDSIAKELTEDEINKIK